MSKELDLTNYEKSTAPTIPEKKAPTFAEIARKRVATIMNAKEADAYIAGIVSLMALNPKLKECNQETILTASLQAQTLGLKLNPALGQAYLVPFNNKNEPKPTANFQIGYKGYIQLAIRSGQYRKINVLEIKQGELIKFDALNEDLSVQLVEDEDEREQLPTIGYFCMFELMNGFRKCMYWSYQKMLSHADKYSQAFSASTSTLKTKYGDKTKLGYEEYLLGKHSPKDEWMYSSFWYKNFDEMAKKTMLRQILNKWGVLSVEMETAYVQDTENLKTTEGDIMDADFTIEQETPEQDTTEAPTPEEPTETPLKPQKPVKPTSKAPITVFCHQKNKDVDELDCPNCPSRQGCPSFD